VVVVVAVTLRGFAEMVVAVAVINSGGQGS